MTTNLHSGAKITKFCKMLLHYINQSKEGKISNKQAVAVAVVRVLPVELIEAIVEVAKHRNKA